MKIDVLNLPLDTYFLLRNKNQQNYLTNRYSYH